MLQIEHREKLHTHDAVKTYLGQMFRVRVMSQGAQATDHEICDLLLK